MFKTYIKNIRKTNHQPFVHSNSLLKELLYFQNEKYVQNKFNLIKNTYLSKILYYSLIF